MPAFVQYHFPHEMADNSLLADLDDHPLPDHRTLAELQIPTAFDFGIFDEAVLLGETPSSLLDGGPGDPHQELGIDHLSWLPPPLDGNPAHLTDEVDFSAAQHRLRARPGPADPAAALKGRVERKAEQNRCGRAIRPFIPVP